LIGKFDARVSAHLLETEEAGTMKHGCDLDDVISQAIDDSIIAVDDLTDRVVAKLRYDTSRAWVVLKPFHDGDNPFDDEVGIVSRVAGDMSAYRLDVLDCLRCPEDPGHRRSRRFASV
jgi:hypothetical protein